MLFSVVNALITISWIVCTESTRIRHQESNFALTNDVDSLRDSSLNQNESVLSSPSTCEAISGDWMTRARNNELFLTGIDSLSFTPEVCTVTKGQPFSGVVVGNSLSSEGGWIIVHSGRKRSDIPANAFRGLLKPENILGVGVGDGSGGRPDVLNFAISGTLSFRLRGDTSEKYTIENFRIAQSSKHLTPNASKGIKSAKMNNWWLASDACEFYSKPLGLRCKATSGAPVCIEYVSGANKFHLSECTYTKSNAKPAILELLKESPSCARDDGLCVAQFSSNDDKLDMHEKLDLNPADNPLYGFLWHQVVKKNESLMQEILQGGHVVLENDALQLQDGQGQIVYEFLKTLPQAESRISSHKSDETTFGVPEGRIMSHLLFGRLDQRTWFQFENSPWSMYKDPIGSIGHAQDAVKYVWTGKNQGPLGESEYVDSNPIRIEELAPIATACPAMCPTTTTSTTTTTTQTGEASGDTSTTTHSGGAFGGTSTTTTTQEEVDVAQVRKGPGNAVIWWVCGAIAVILALALVLYFQCSRNGSQFQWITLGGSFTTASGVSMQEGSFTVVD